MQKTAIITGASRGMGRNTAVNLATRGVDVIFTYHSNKTEAESLIREIEAKGPFSQHKIMLIHKN